VISLPKPLYVHRIYMVLANPIYIATTQLLSVIFVDGATHQSQKDGVEGNGGSLKEVAEIFVLFLCSAVLGLVFPQT